MNDKVDLVSIDDGENAALLDTAKFNHMWRVATMFSKSDLVPQQYKDKPENCMVAISTALRMRVDPLMFLQKSYVVQGKPGIESQLAIALANSSKVFDSPIEYKVTGEGVNKSCVAYAKRGDTTIEGPPVSIKMAQDEGWATKNGSKWKTMPDMMLRYRAAMFLIRAYAPEVLMGLTTREELVDIHGEGALKDVTPANKVDEVGEELLKTVDKSKDNEDKPIESAQDSML